jgi:hypothetical protein
VVNNILKLLLFAIFISAFSSCGLFGDDEDTEKRTIISGKVFAKYNNTPLAGINVYLYRAHEAIGYYKFDSTLTLADGSYAFNTLYKNENVMYGVTAIDLNYFTYGGYWVAEVGESNEINLFVYPLAYLNFSIKNIFPTQTSDQFSFTFDNYSYYQLKGALVDTNFTIRIPKDSTLHFVISQKSNGKDSIYSKYLNPIAGDTTFWKFEY